LNQFLRVALTTENGFEIVFGRNSRLLIGLLEKGPSSRVHILTLVYEERSVVIPGELPRRERRHIFSLVGPVKVEIAALVLVH
jgi:hypothetical protein